MKLFNKFNASGEVRNLEQIGTVIIMADLSENRLLDKIKRMYTPFVRGKHLQWF